MRRGRQVLRWLRKKKRFVGGNHLFVEQILPLQVMVTKNKELLLGASYFDLSHCGYIETKDLEDILVPLQLDLSRAEIKKLASKLATKDQVDIQHHVSLSKLDFFSSSTTVF